MFTGVRNDQRICESFLFPSPPLMAIWLTLWPSLFSVPILSPTTGQAIVCRNCALWMSPLRLPRRFSLPTMEQTPRIQKVSCHSESALFSLPHELARFRHRGLHAASNAVLRALLVQLLNPSLLETPLVSREDSQTVGFRVLLGGFFCLCPSSVLAGFLGRGGRESSCGLSGLRGSRGKRVVEWLCK